MAGCEGSSQVCDEMIKNTECRAGPHWPPLWEAPSSQDPVCTFGGNNSPGPSTSSFGLLRFMALSCAVQLLSSQLPSALIGREASWREEDEGEETGKQLGWGGLVWDATEVVFHIHYRWQAGDNFPLCRPHVLFIFPTTLAWWSERNPILPTSLYIISGIKSVMCN